MAKKDRTAWHPTRGIKCLLRRGRLRPRLRTRPQFSDCRTSSQYRQKNEPFKSIEEWRIVGALLRSCCVDYVTIQPRRDRALAHSC